MVIFSLIRNMNCQGLLYPDFACLFCPESSQTGRLSPSSTVVDVTIVDFSEVLARPLRITVRCRNYVPFSRELSILKTWRLYNGHHLFTLFI